LLLGGVRSVTLTAGSNLSRGSDAVNDRAAR
jgi:hypothetical protein